MTMILLFQVKIKKKNRKNSYKCNRKINQKRKSQKIQNRSIKMEYESIL